MLTNSIIPSVLSVAALLATADAALDPIVIKGSKFFKKTDGSQFYIKGVAYQTGIGASGTSTSNGSTTTGYTDPLADEAACTRDVPYLQRLGTNTIRTYAIDPTKDHSACMKLLDAAGIYVISDLSEPNQSINRDDPAWNTALYSRYASVIDSLAPYNNVIGFFAGNEVSNSPQTTNATAFVKAAVRDMKAYINTKGYRAMGVGYAADDDAISRANVANYMNCGDAKSAIDFWGYNIYEWCGDSTFATSGYKDRTAEFSNYTVPAFFAEYGCNNVPGGAKNRPFSEVQSLFGPDMNGVFNGGIVYEYFQETNDYGLVTIANNAVSTMSPVFNNLATQISSARALATGVNQASYTPTNTVARSCPAVDTIWQAASALPPTPNSDLCACMVKSLSCTLKSSVATTSYGTLFGQICGYNKGAACAGIARSPSTGVYGAYSMCDAASQLAFAMNAYYLGQNKASTACDFAGAAQINNAPSTASTCSALLSQAGASGTGQVTSVPTGAGASGSAGSGAGSPAASSSTHSAANGLTVGASFAGSWLMGVYAAVAGIAGIGMILL